jgi:hypothetical protein
MNTNGGWGCCAKIWPRPRRPDPTSARPATALPCAVRRRGNPVFVEQWVTAPGCCLVGDINVSGPVDRNTPEAVEPVNRGTAWAVAATASFSTRLSPLSAM